MRSFSLIALVAAAIIGSSSAGKLKDAGKDTKVTVSASAYDERTSGSGCEPNGCVPALTRDRSRAPASRWSCMEDLEDEQCEIKYMFKDPQDIEELRIKFYKGNERVRSLKVTDNKGYKTFITSSGSANGFEKFKLGTYGSKWIALEGKGLEGDEWISITEVKLMVKN